MKAVPFFTLGVFSTLAVLLIVAESQSVSVRWTHAERTVRARGHLIASFPRWP